jgi:type IV pilus assembly protein PilC
MKKLWITRFSRTLSSLLSGGVGLVAALPISCEVANNLYLKQIIEDIRNSVVGGAILSASFKKEKIFPGMFVKMIQVGEKTGKLSEMLKRNADHYENELEEIISAFSALVEPVLIVFVGSIVGVVVVAFYLPIFKISQLIK